MIHVDEPQDPTFGTIEGEPTTKLGKAKAHGKTAWRVFADWFNNWQEILVWLPVVMFGVLFFNKWVPMVDPRAGVDGLGALTGYAMLGVRFVLSAAAAFFLKRTYFGYKHPRELRDLSAAVLAGDRDALRLLRLDRLEWIPCLLFGYFCFTG